MGGGGQEGGGEGIGAEGAPGAGDAEEAMDAGLCHRVGGLEETGALAGVRERSSTGEVHVSEARQTSMSGARAGGEALEANDVAGMEAGICRRVGDGGGMRVEEDLVQAGSKSRIRKRRPPISQATSPWPVSRPRRWRKARRSGRASEMAWAVAKA